MPNPKIEHFVVLMLENRSFDHLLGYLYPASATFEGVKGKEGDYFNYTDPLNPTGSKIFVNPNATSRDLNKDSGHDFADVHEQLFGLPLGGSGTPQPPENGGFLRNYARKNKGNGARIMNLFNPSSLPILNRLAAEFAVCDHWFSSTPGPTWPNRLFVHTGASDGRVDNKYRVYDDETIYNLMTRQHGEQSWSFFLAGWITQAMALSRLYSFKKWAFRSLGSFEHMAATGTLPKYSFIEPRFYRFEGLKPPNDQHPPHDVHRGEDLIADIYKMVRTSPKWNETLLVITYDEHGGTYDHVHPPAATPPGKESKNPPFRFDRYGVRVPAVVISPYIERGTVVNDVLDHTSAIATVRSLFTISEYLTPRVLKATPIDKVVFNRNVARTDAPIDIRDLVPAEDKMALLESLAVTEPWPGDPSPGLNEYQEQLLIMSRDLARRPEQTLDMSAAELQISLTMTEDVAAREVEQNIRAFLAQPE